MSEADKVPTPGQARALRLIDDMCGLSTRAVPVSFARIIVGLFPAWFDFGADKFAVLSWERGLHLVVSGHEWGFAVISTSDSRMISCVYVGSTIETARMDMHYTPFEEQAERARVVIRMVLRRLFPDRDDLPTELQRLIPSGKVFPPTWDGSVGS